jgi:hypothetical protein
MCNQSNVFGLLWKPRGSFRGVDTVFLYSFFLPLFHPQSTVQLKGLIRIHIYLCCHPYSIGFFFEENIHNWLASWKILGWLAAYKKSDGFKASLSSVELVCFSSAQHPMFPLPARTLFPAESGEGSPGLREKALSELLQRYEQGFA